MHAALVKGPVLRLIPDQDPGLILEVETDQYATSQVLELGSSGHETSSIE